MYSLKKNGETLYIVEKKPTKAEMEKMGCDEAIPYQEEIREPTKAEIGDKILQEVFDGNQHAQIADLTKSQVTTLYLLVPILGKETVKLAYADLIATLNKVSAARVASGLEPFDLSFLD